MVNDLVVSTPRLPAREVTGYRLVNAKFPPIHLLDDVADADEFDALYAIQALTNPGLQNETGNLELLPRAEIPFGIPGCANATAPFTHVNPDGSRFSNGSYGVLYLGNALETATAEVRHHQDRYWRNVPGLKFERFVFRGLNFRFDEEGCINIRALPPAHPLYDPVDYGAGHQLGALLTSKREAGICYRSVRQADGTCWGLLTPKRVVSAIQTQSIEMIWQNGITAVQQCTSLA